MNSDMASARPAGAGLLAGAVYFVLIFALGFALGFIRDIILRAGEPEGGRIIAVLIELPVMLLASWFVCAFVIKRFAVPAAARERALMGLVAFGLLMLAELCLSLFCWAGPWPGISRLTPSSATRSASPRNLASRRFPSHRFPSCLAPREALGGSVPGSSSPSAP